jgi:hypothetical protein
MSRTHNSSRAAIAITVGLFVRLTKKSSNASEIAPFNELPWTLHHQTIQRPRDRRRYPSICRRCATSALVSFRAPEKNGGSGTAEGTV